MKIRAAHLVYPEGTFPEQKRWVMGSGVEIIPELREETLCTSCLKIAWRINDWEGEEGVRKAAQHMTKVAHICERVDLLEEDMLEYGMRCRVCGKDLKEQ